MTIEVGVDDEGRRQVVLVRYAILDDKPKSAVFTIYDVSSTGVITESMLRRASGLFDDEGD